MDSKAVVTPEQESEQVPTVLKWGEVIKQFIEALIKAKKGKQVGNFQTAFNLFLESSGLTEDSPVGTELTEEFEVKIQAYIDFQIQRRLSKSTYDPRVSKIRTLKKFVDANFAASLKLRTLPEGFSQRLRALIAALGVTIKEFWRSLPEGLLEYHTLTRWCRGVFRPSKRLLPVISVIETYLGVKPGTLFLSRYLQKGSNLLIGQSTYGNKIRAALSKPYFTWTECIELEFQNLFLHKTTAILPEYEERSEEGQWTSNEVGEIPSADIARAAIRKFLGHCALAEDSPDPYLRGAGIRSEDLSIALFADKMLVENHLEFMKLRSGLRVRPVTESAAAELPAHMISANKLWEFYDNGGKYNQGSVWFLTFVSSLLRPGTGYLYQHPEYAEKLGNRMIAETWEEQCKVTRNRVLILRKRILRMKKKGDRKNYELGRDPKEIIQWILELPRPLLILQEMIKDLFEDLLPKSDPELERARQFRDLTLVALLCANPLRIFMFSYMKFDEHLIRRCDGSWWIKFNKEAFKNRRALECDYLVRVAEELWPILDRYRKEFHPILARSSGSKYVFIGSGLGRHKKREGEPLSETSLSGIIRLLTELYIPGVIGFRPHAFRHIIATDIIKKDPRIGFFLASRALHDKLETVEKEYIHLRTSEYFEPVNAHFSEAWSQVFKSSTVESR